MCKIIKVELRKLVNQNAGKKRVFCRVPILLMIFSIIAAIEVTSNCFDLAPQGGVQSSATQCIQGTRNNVQNSFFHNSIWDVGNLYCIDGVGKCHEIAPDLEKYSCCELQIGLSYYTQCGIDCASNCRSYGRFTNASGTCFELSCTEDINCIYAEGRLNNVALKNYEYCSRDSGLCNPIVCSQDSDCMLGSACKNNYCSHLYDHDQDGLLGSVISDGSLYTGAGYDCDDNHYFCTTDCATQKPGCETFCTDKDNDGACEEVLRPLGSDILAAGAAGADYKSQIDLWYLRMFNVQYSDYISFDDTSCKDKADNIECCNTCTGEMCSNTPHMCGTKESKYVGNVLYPGETYDSSKLDSWIGSEKGFSNFDCNDNDPTINPFSIEDNSCNFIDDDCDKQVDECSDWLPPASWERSSPPPAGSGAAVIGPVPESTQVKETGKNMLTGMPVADRPVTIPIEELQAIFGIRSRSCVYKQDFKGCHVLDFDGDGYKNASFGCPDCTDCNDFDANIHPGAIDKSSSVDMNCNGVSGEMVDDDSDGIYDNWDDCDKEGLGSILELNPIDYMFKVGCWFSTVHKSGAQNNLVGWS